MNCDESIQPLYIPIGQPFSPGQFALSERAEEVWNSDVASELVEGDWEQGTGKSFLHIVAF